MWEGASGQDDSGATSVSFYNIKRGNREPAWPRGCWKQGGVRLAFLDFHPRSVLGFRPLPPPLRMLGGRSVDAPWTLRGRSVEAPWGLRERSVNSQWTVSGQSVDDYWTVTERSVYAPWWLHGGSVEAPWALCAAFAVRKVTLRRLHLPLVVVARPLRGPSAFVGDPKIPQIES